MSSAWASDLIRAAEDRLRSHLAAARAALDAASAHHRELMRLQMAHGLTSDGTVTLQEAEQIHRMAIRRYASALAQFSDLVIRGRLPVGGPVLVPPRGPGRTNAGAE